MSGNLIDRFTVDTDFSGIHVIEAHQEVDKCCFSASGRTYDRNTHTRFNLKVKVFNQRFTLVIAEIYVVDIHISIHLFSKTNTAIVHYIRFHLSFLYLFVLYVYNILYSFCTVKQCYT